MGIVKVHRYGVRANWLGGGRLALEAPGKPLLRVATPPEFKDGVPGVWSPEELLIGSFATCFELTFVAIANLRRLPLHAMRVDGTGHVERTDRHYRFVAIELDVDLETEVGYEHEAEEVATLAKERCLVGGALEMPVRLTVEARAGDVAAATAA